MEELEKWSSPPSYSEVVTKDSTSSDGEELDKSEANDASEEESPHVTIDMEMLTSEAGLPSYDDACRINNINNNYI